MSDPDLPPIESVSGGSHGVRAGFEQMLALATICEDKAADLREMVGLGCRVMTDGDLVESAVLSPSTFADAERRLLDATTGVDGLTVRSAGIEADALGIRAVVAAFRASDSWGRHAAERLANTLGRGIGLTLPVVLPALLVAGGVAHVHLRSLSPVQRQRLLAGVSDDLGQLLRAHPALAQHIVNSGGGVLEGLGLPVGILVPGDGPVTAATTNDAARLLALLLGNDTAAQVERLDGVLPTDAQTTAPTSLGDLMRSLGETNAIDARHPGRHGAIQVQRILGEDGQERFVVYVPGTDDFSAIPQDGDHARDMESSYQLIGGLDSAYGDGVAEAMRVAGLGGQDVMLVGHSQGGMVAISLAADPEFAREFTVRHVVTAGAPTAHVVDLPSTTHALHLENRGDAVPMLDGEDNPDQPHRTTVRFDQGSSDTVDNHTIERYVSGAAAADASTNGSIQDHITAMRDDGFLGTGTVTGVDTFQIRRGRG